MGNQILSKLADKGNGRSYVILYGDPLFADTAQRLFESLSLRYRVLLVRLQGVSKLDWEQASESLVAFLTDEKIRQASFVSFGESTFSVQYLALSNPKLIRTLVFVKPETRPQPSVIERIVRRIESILPLGLPLRRDSGVFDSRSFLQRIRCPSLIISAKGDDHFSLDQAHKMSRSLPTSWHTTIESLNDSETLVNLAEDFELIPPKFPQKNLRKSSSTKAA